MDKHNHIYVPKHNEEILTPFGPAVGYKKLSDDFVKFLNKNLDDNLEDFLINSFRHRNNIKVYTKGSSFTLTIKWINTM